MSDIDLLIDAFESGNLLRPSADTPNVVDLSNAIASLVGVPDTCDTPGSRQIGEIIGQPEHLVFALCDGFGMHFFIESMDENDFVPQHVAMELRTVFPSSTPVVLTSLTTGEWPARHAITGWDMYLPELHDVATIIRFHRRSDEKALDKLNIEPGQAYTLPSMFNRTRIHALTLLPDYIANSAFSNYAKGNSEQVAYKELEHAVDFIINSIANADAPTYTYLYTPLIDSNAHEFGVTHRNTLACVRKVNRNLERLASGLPGNARLVMTADHGLVDTPYARIQTIEKSDQLLKHLKHEPYGDGRAMYFDIARESVPAFRDQFKRRFGDRFALISAEEMNDLKLLGPDPVSPLTMSRIGNLIAIPVGSDSIRHRFGVQKKGKTPVAGHGGLSPDEMRIPLLVA
jgi:hypothetical protein